MLWVGLGGMARSASTYSSTSFLERSVVAHGARTWGKTVLCKLHMFSIRLLILQAMKSGSACSTLRIGDFSPLPTL